MNLKKNKKWIAPAIVLLMAVLPLFIHSTYFILLLNFAGLYMISVSGLDLLFGYTGQISLGHSAFYGIGAYCTAICTTRFGIPVLPAILISILVAVLFGMLLAIPASKLVGHFLALLTICFGELFYQVVANFTSWSGGFSGINFIPNIGIFGLTLHSNKAYYYFILVCVVLFMLFKQHLVNSRQGRAMIAIRENAHAANGTGVNVNKQKIAVFAISAAFTAFTGCVYACLVGYISPETFKQSQSLIYLTMLLLGGMGNFVGPLIGATLITFVKEYLQAYGSYQMLIYGAIIIIVVLFAPDGIVGLAKSIGAKFKKKEAATNA